MAKNKGVHRKAGNNHKFQKKLVHRAYRLLKKKRAVELSPQEFKALVESQKGQMRVLLRWILKWTVFEQIENRAVVNIPSASWVLSAFRAEPRLWRDIMRFSRPNKQWEKRIMYVKDGCGELRSEIYDFNNQLLESYDYKTPTSSDVITDN